MKTSRGLGGLINFTAIVATLTGVPKNSCCTELKFHQRAFRKIRRKFQYQATTILITVTLKFISSKWLTLLMPTFERPNII